MKPASDPSLDAPTVVGHKPTGLVQARRPAQNPFDTPTTPMLPPQRQPQTGSFQAPRAPLSGLAPTEPAFDLAARPKTPVAARDGGKGSALQLASEPSGPSEALVAAASPLLVLVAQLRDSVEFADVETLRGEVVNQVQKFEETAVKFGAVAGDITAARYILCSLIDETVMTTPWGSASSWSASSLLNRFHNETWGGEKVFAILDRVKADPKKNLPLLKLVNLVLLLGFEGMHRVLDNGRERLADLRDEVGTLVAQHSAPPPSELSAGWRGISGEKTLRSFLPLWVVFALAGFLLVCIYGYQHYRLSSGLAPVVEQLRALGGTASPGAQAP